VFFIIRTYPPPLAFIIATIKMASEGAVEPTKVFVGNLSFKTREADLAHEFSVAGHVVSANIITRGPRSLGYGFVEMENDQAAEKAVELMNKKEIDGREINVEVAKPRQADSARPPRNVGGGNGGNGGGAPRGGGGGNRARGARRGSRGSGAGGRGGNGGRRPRNSNNNNEGDNHERPQREQKDRTPSSTTLFVANLPFSVDDDALAKIFEGLTISSAHVVRKRNGRSKGFGFVEFPSEADQQKALDAKKGAVVEERELIIKVALKDSEENAQAAAGDAAPAAASK